MNRHILNTSYFIRRERSEARVSSLPPGSRPPSSLSPLSRAPVRSPRAFRARRAAREELVWAKKQKHKEKTAEGSATTKKIEGKKKEPKWRHTFSVFSGHPPVLLANSFFRRRPSPSCPPVPASPSRTLRGLYTSPSLSSPRVFSRDPLHPRATAILLFYFLTPSLFF